MRLALVVSIVAACGHAAPGVSPAASEGGFKSPPIVDSHVHLTFWPVADKLAAAGVEGAVDLAAPERTLGGKSAIALVEAGPMITHDDGYPLDAWGSDGYGVGCKDAACVTATVDRLAAHGARVIKLALDSDGLAPDLVPVAVAAAHAKKLKVAAHALTESAARLAGESGVDVLAHTPVEPLSAPTVALWKGRACISTLAAFGGTREAVDNLRKLREAGCTVLYGTDLGNLRDAGPSEDEMRLLRAAGLDDAAITDAMTTVPATFWGFDFTGTYLVVDKDPHTDASALLSPREVYVHGTKR